MALISGCSDAIAQSLLTTDEQGYTAIHRAVIANDLAVLQQLLPYADREYINRESNDRSTALLLLCKRLMYPGFQAEKPCRQMQEEILVSLLAAGADPNLPQPDPVSLPLLCALEKRWWRGAELLLDAGADAKAMDVEHSQRPATYLARNNVDILIRLLKEGCANDEVCSWIADGIF
ncbi:uncharacterized protein LOC108681821, partial [Hyalella azteca]|uniref:Uncharacterized protein LOC108681821 n=1 Tax=Hyalella azteca TaxID=294128 RepID=A0A8B7PK70_HYAAZ